MERREPFIQIIPYFADQLDEIISSIYKNIEGIKKDKKQKYPKWELIRTKRPVNYTLPHDLPLIKMKHQIYKNFGYLMCVKYKETIEVKFVNPKYGTGSSVLCKSYLYSEFITMLRAIDIPNIKHISILDYEPLIQVYPQGSDIYLHYMIHWSVKSQRLNEEVYKDLTSPLTPYSRYEKYKDFYDYQETYKNVSSEILDQQFINLLWDKELRKVRKIEFIPGIESFILRFHQNTIESINKRKKLIILSILYLYYLRLRYPNSWEGIQILNL